MAKKKQNDKYSEYKQQFDALMVVLDSLISKYSPTEEHDAKDGSASQATSFNDQERILDLLQGLHEFATGQFNFFYYGFRGGDEKMGIPALRPEVSAKDKTIEYPPEHVLAMTITQVSEDLTTIQLAAEQRILGHKKEAQISTSRADDIAEDALWKPAFRYRKTPAYSRNTKVLSYFTNSTKIRVTPYSSASLIGLPYSYRAHPTGGLAIPHEIGHFLYWFPGEVKEPQFKFLGIEPDEKTFLLNIRELYYPFSSTTSDPRWSEEIFADTYGVYIAEAPFIESAMERALQDSTEAFCDFDLDDPHPTALIRPLLMIKAMSAMSTPFIVNGAPLWEFSRAQIEKKTKRLFNDWKRHLNERCILRIPKNTRAGNNSKDLSYEFVDPKLALAVAEIVDWDSRFINRSFAAERLVLNACEALSNTFGGWNNPTFSLPMPKPGNSDTKPTWGYSYTKASRWEQWISDKRYFDSDHFNLARKVNEPSKMPFIPRKKIWAGKFDKVMHPRLRPSNAWLPVFGAGGWTTGPCGSPKRIDGPK